jgi:tRNA1Val (adenine37-N6)-methyltransferase
MPIVTRDYFYEKKVTILQNRDGYRFSVDAPILAHFLPTSPHPALEIGCGSGVVSLLALYTNTFPQITAVEISESQSLLAEKNAQVNFCSTRLRIVCADFREVSKHFPRFHTIFSNPPFYSPLKGHVSQNNEIRQAKFEVSLNLAELLSHAAPLLEDSGSLYLIFPAEREGELVKAAEKVGLFPAAVRRIYPFATGKADRLVIQLGKSRVPPAELKPLVIFKDKGVYSDDMRIIFAGRDSDDPKA